ncbi:MAG: GNAT family N-acetyltransferase [Propionibacteriaceae bacterium]|jgi:ribosomal-protein-serine acetyltransferase|nr:GNAT family N-acetyltransferase [Propionibacteriaceae bacterium]
MFFRPIDEHLALKLYSTRDAEEAYAIIDRERERLRVYLPWVDQTHSVEDERNGLAALSQYDPDRLISCWVTLDGAIIGGCGLVTINTGAKWAEVGYWISADYEGHGYITAAVRKLEQLCFTELGLERVQITNDATNTRSRAIPERLGYALEGVLRHELLSGEGRIVDRSVYGLLKSEWEAREAL